jgi:hypothetical protein
LVFILHKKEAQRAAVKVREEEAEAVVCIREEDRHLDKKVLGLPRRGLRAALQELL